MRECLQAFNPKHLIVDRPVRNLLADQHVLLQRCTWTSPGRRALRLLSGCQREGRRRRRGLKLRKAAQVARAQGEPARPAQSVAQLRSRALRRPELPPVQKGRGADGRLHHQGGALRPNAVIL